VTVLAALLVGAQSRVAPYVGAIFRSALDHVDGERDHGGEAEQEHNGAEDAEEERRMGGGGEHPGLSVRLGVPRATEG
jgi:hypothetical protein